MKIINLILGLGIGIILASLVGFGIQAFYPAPEYPEADYSEVEDKNFSCDLYDEKCFDEETAYYKEQGRQRAEQDKEYSRQLKEYDEAVATYGRNFFIILNLIGLLIFLGGLFLLFVSVMATQSIAIGVTVAGLLSIIIGYMTTGWNNPGDQLQFVVGLLVAVVVVISTWLMQKYHQKHAQPPSQTQF